MARGHSGGQVHQHLVHWVVGIDHRAHLLQGGAVGGHRHPGGREHVDLMAVRVELLAVLGEDGLVHAEAGPAPWTRRRRRSPRPAVASRPEAGPSRPGTAAPASPAAPVQAPAPSRPWSRRAPRTSRPPKSTPPPPRPMGAPRPRSAHGPRGRSPRPAARSTVAPARRPRWRRRRTACGARGRVPPTSQHPRPAPPARRPRASSPALRLRLSRLPSATLAAAAPPRSAASSHRPCEPCARPFSPTTSPHAR
mmetsp:Transcript_71839/g.206242  ORF Transcript_71839/g.206242 Transcript_71839/m.206242 type:complete len:251 (+) Transcript_71839:296-1048(+)